MEIKARDIEGFLIEKLPYLQSKKGYPDNLVDIRDRAIKEQGDKVLVINICTVCNGDGWYPQQVSDTEQEQRRCDCYDGVEIKAI